MNNMKYFSNRTLDIGSASSIEQNERVYELIENGIQPIILSYGEAPFETEPVDFSKIDHSRGAHYSQGIGVKEFRDEISIYLDEFHDAKINPDKNIMVSCGSKIISFFTSQLCLNPGNVMLLHEPSWVSYQEHAKFSGATTEFIPYYESILSAKDYFKSNPNIKNLVLNNPNNPRGYIYSEDELRQLAKDCYENDVILTVDESYSDFCGDIKFFSSSCLINEFPNVVSLNSISKNFGLSGWRIGYAVGSKEMIAGLNKFNQHLMTCAPTILQLALAKKGLSNLRREVDPSLNDLIKKRKDVENLLTKYEFDFLGGSGTFYYFIDVSDYVNNTKEFVMNLLNKRHVSIIPGGAYGKSTEGFLRLSFGNEPIERIDEGLKIIKEELKNG